MACCHLFVISRVESVETRYSPDLDYSDMGSARLPDDCHVFRGYGVPTNRELRNWQKEANRQSNDWRYDPVKVALQELQQAKSGSLQEVLQVHETEPGEGFEPPPTHPIRAPWKRSWKRNRCLIEKSMKSSKKTANPAGS
jgi:hypothetical protein